jgi:hypothetical protein
MAKFEAGKSGNPKGRPKGARNLRTQYLDEVNSPETSEPESASKLQAAIRAQIEKAVQGDIRAIRDVMERVEKWEVERNSRERGPNFTEADREVIAEVHRRLAPSALAGASPMLRAGEESRGFSSPASGGGAELREAEGAAP